MHAQGARHGLGRLHHVARRALGECTGLPEHGDAGYVREHILEQLQALGGQLWGEKGEPSQVPSRLRQAGDEPILDRIPHDRSNDGDGHSCLSGGNGSRCIARDDEVDVKANQLHRQIREMLDLALREPILDRDVLILNIAELTQALPEGVDRRERVGGLRPSSQEEANLRDFRRLLRACRERPSRRAAEQRDELAPFHSTGLHAVPRQPGRIAGYRFRGRESHSTPQSRLHGSDYVCASAEWVQRKSPGKLTRRGYSCRGPSGGWGGDRDVMGRI